MTSQTTPWLPDLPASWKRAQIRRVAEIRNGADYKAVEVAEGGYPVYGSGGEFRRAGRYLFDGESVLFGRKGTIDRPLHVKGRFWTVDTMFYTDLDRAMVVPRYLYYYATTMPFGLYATNTALPSVTGAQIASHTMPLPPLEVQRAIADYLDRETARIDTLIEEQQRLIEMLRERRDSTWDTGVEAARAAGDLLPVRRVIASIVDGPFGSSLTSSHYVDEGARVIRLGNIGNNEFKNHDSAFISLDYAEELEAHAVVAGDVVVAGLGDDKMPLGRAAVVPDLGSAIVKADCYRLRPNDSISPQYLAWVMSAPQTRAQIMLLARGATRARLNTKVVQQVEIPVPDREAQSEIVARSVEETAKIDALIVETDRFIELSRERRAALITAAVTGQIDVREVA
ncbi:restriction endonuclease subunit S [Janibacter hoylei]|uniref:restriction endonuclease subunit S n=1 Tax=Janibacter hoylei TaxID=364298 RepID=UPI0021A32061|nr:restriction endonuclease subunit S [Janibacter hoylei]MCT1619652.1 restriction endonuclease subunit S [Janibacter hoylei]MCT2294164.1 restriction endonuclease subunit S [Janibacter hoylei]MCW4601689.1 restriction endonuclease subunit S [Janibacter hoylei]